MEKKHKTKKMCESSKEKFMLPAIIADGLAFKQLDNPHRRELYTKMDEFYRPAREHSRYKKWFLYPTDEIPAGNREFHLSVMTHCLTEVINDMLSEMIERYNLLNDLIPQFNQYINDYEREYKEKYQAAKTA